MFTSVWRWGTPVQLAVGQSDLMSRDSKIEVSAINLRIPESKNRDYSGLIKTLSDLKRGVKVYGDSYVAINYYNELSKWGVISKYTEIDIDGEWFNIEDFSVATVDQVGKIVIPDNLKPNLAQFYFMIDTDLHIFVFSSYSESKGLSARSMGLYFKEALEWTEITDQFGRVESDIVKSYDQVDRLLSLPNIKEITVIINRPNPDDIGESLATIIENRLSEQNADQYQETLKAKGPNSIVPSERTKDLAKIAAENGTYRQKSVVNGVLKSEDTDNSPLFEVKKYKSHESEQRIFFSLAKKLIDRVRVARESLNA